MSEEKERGIPKDEITRSIAKLNNNKAHIRAEMLKVSWDMRALKFCIDIWDTSIRPKVWKKSVFIPLHEKGRTIYRGNHRTICISLIAHAGKVMLNGVHER